MDKKTKIEQIKKQIETNTDFEFLSNSYEELINLLKESIISDEKIIDEAKVSKKDLKLAILDLELSLQKLCKLIMEKIQKLDCELKVNLENKKDKKEEIKKVKSEIRTLKNSLIPKIDELKNLEEQKLKKLSLDIIETKKVENYIKDLEDILEDLKKDQTLDEFLQNENVSNLKVKNYGDEHKSYILKRVGLGLGICMVTLAIFLAGVKIGKNKEKEEENKDAIEVSPTPGITNKPTPTVKPTQAVKPTPTPTNEPTQAVKPTPTPTNEPTQSIKPTETPTMAPTLEEIIEESKIDYKEYKQNLKDINSKYVIEKGILTLEQAIAFSYYANGENLKASAKVELENEELLPNDDAKIITDNANAINNVVANVLNNAYAGNDNVFELGDFVIDKEQKRTISEIESIVNKLYTGTKDEKIDAYSKMVDLCLLRRNIQNEDGYVITLNNLPDSLEYEVLYAVVLPANVYAGTEGINQKCSYPTSEGDIITNANDAIDYVVSTSPNPLAINTSKNCQKIYN